MISPERQPTVLNILENFRGLDPLKKLFWQELNYQRVNQPIPRQGWSEAASGALAEDPVLLAGAGQNDAFHVIYARLASDRLWLGQERPVISHLLQNHPYALFVLSNRARDRWHFVNVKYDDEPTKRRIFRRITVGAEERMRTASERLAMLDCGSTAAQASALEIQSKQDEAFDVEPVRVSINNAQLPAREEETTASGDSLNGCMRSSFAVRYSVRGASARSEV